MQSQWLYQQIQQENQLDNKKWKPEFSLPSTLNWMQALSFEITQEHGTTSTSQFASCQSIFDKSVTRLERKIALAPIFEPLFHSLTFAITLTSMVEDRTCRPWTFPSAIISWYYATYNAFRSIIEASGTDAPDHHAGLQRCLFGNNIRPKLPHPFNMVAVYKRNEEYSIELPSHTTEVVTVPLEQAFLNSHPQAQGMLLAYLKGTATWEVNKKKETLLKENSKFKDFRGKEAQNQRNKQLQKKLPEVNFMHCAFRYRGKANYRDGIFLTYGSDDSRISLDFIKALETAAHFAFLCGLAYSEQRIGKSHTKNFLIDISQYFRGQSYASPEEKIWDEVLSSYFDNK